jgi:multiple sugar transport system substrate-binding protein
MKSKIAVVLCIVLIFCITGCGAFFINGSRIGDIDHPCGGVQIIFFSEKLADHTALPDVEVTEKLRVLSWFPIDHALPALELFKERYGIPERERCEYNIIERTNVSYARRYEVLANMVASDDSPDMFPYEDRFFPWGIHMGLFEPVDDIIDFSAPEWDATRGFIEAHRFGGRDYTAITELVPSTGLLYYRKSIMEQYELEDPYELWQKNQWTWDVFLEHMEVFCNSEEIRHGVFGMYLDEAAIATAGTPLIGLENGKLVSNLDHGNIERAADFLQTLADREYRFPYNSMNFSNSMQGLRNRTILFWNDGPWQY